MLYPSSLKLVLNQLKPNEEKNSAPLDELDCFEGLVHVSDGEEITEVHHCVPGGLVSVFQPNEISEDSPADRITLEIVVCLRVSYLRCIRLETKVKVKVTIKVKVKLKVSVAQSAFNYSHSDPKHHRQSLNDHKITSHKQSEDNNTITFKENLLF